ncbi:MAG: UvrD-helicase domain-containing protein, partial [Kiritimatiellia bacterium]
MKGRISSVIMHFYADLHVHSRFSRATGRDCTFEQLSYWAQRKGLAVVGTGDFTHPGWRGEMREKLVEAEPGLYRLRNEIESAIRSRLPSSCHQPTRFMITGEISTIYKQGSRTRKVHHLVVMPDLASAEKFATKLARIGNLESDGRPILGFKSRDLLEMVLETSPEAFLIPAHIWTPWFSVLGAASGFNSIAECYGELASSIFALETGLSSDPPMNWRLSALDDFRLVSNSDAHSPSKLGREACVFETALDFLAMRRALATGTGYAGTVEFFPEEGKYHLDGHRKCGVRLTPRETKAYGGKCPHCGKALTVGVMHRVEELADRPEGARPPHASPFRSLIPLDEILGEILRVGHNSGKVREALDRLTARLGPELSMLEAIPLEEIARAGSSLLSEAIGRMRSGRVSRQAGYDGEYGTIRIFSPDELLHGKNQPLLVEVRPVSEGIVQSEIREDSATELLQARDRTTSDDSCACRTPALLCQGKAIEVCDGSSRSVAGPSSPRDGYGSFSNLDPDQRSAVSFGPGALVIIAGPGTGKTHTLTHRIAHLVLEFGVAPETCLAITFTRRAAGEMRERLEALAPRAASKITIATFHGLAYLILREFGECAGLCPSFRVIGEIEQRELLASLFSISHEKATRIAWEISSFKRAGVRTECLDVPETLATYDREMRKRNLVDFDDLILFSVAILRDHPQVRASCRTRYQWVFVDEFQDVDVQQYALLRELVPEGGNVCVIGDPDQAIYGFRGTDPRCFIEFYRDYQKAETIRLTRNYRSAGRILSAATQVISAAATVRERSLQPMLEEGTAIVIHEAANEKAEAEFVVATIERIIGGASFFSFDSDRVRETEKASVSFSDFAILYRTDEQSRV